MREEGGRKRREGEKGEGEEEGKEGRKEERRKRERDSERDPSLPHSPSGEAEPAKAILQRILDRDNSSMESHLLMARIHLHLGKPKQCLASLELALSSNFEVGSLDLKCHVFSTVHIIAPLPLSTIEFCVPEEHAILGFLAFMATVLYRRSVHIIRCSTTLSITW